MMGEAQTSGGAIPGRTRVWSWPVLIASWLLGLGILRPAFGLQGSLEVVSFTGPLTGQPVTFSLYLPPGYLAGTNRYPAVYHLHGIGGSFAGQQTNLVPANLEAAVAAGLIEPCMVVFPDGYTDSFWADSVNSAKPAETNVRHEIIPYVDATYRTVASRNRRVIQGFSMGGFGAAKFATKFPEAFAACVVYDGAMLSWPQVEQRHATQAAEIFNHSAEIFDLYSPWYWLSRNAAQVRSSVPFRDSVGALLSENRSWREALLGQGITPDYTETGCAHALGCLLEAQGANSWAFISQAFAAADAGTSGLRLAIAKQGNNALLQWPAAASDVYALEHRAALGGSGSWSPVATNLVGSNVVLQVAHTNALLAPSGFYRLIVGAAPSNPPPAFAFAWTGTNFTYTDASRTFTGIMLKPEGNGPFPAVVISHGAGGSANGYSLTKAREMLSWGLLTIAPNLTHAAGGETNAVNMGFCPENLARLNSCLDVLNTLLYVDTNRLALFGHSMGAFATVGSAGVLTNRLRAVAITAGGVIPDPAGTNSATPTITEANPIRTPLLMIHCDADPVVPPSRSQLLQQGLNSNGIPNLRVIVSSNSVPSAAWHNLHQDASANTLILTNTRSWFQTHGLLP